MTKQEAILERIRAVPLTPGCYLYKDKQGQIIYIGKSKALRNRMRQYFQKPEEKEGKYVLLLRQIADFEIICTDSESEALLLECMLVKHYQPRYNAQLKRTKTYPYIKIDTSQEYPSISITRERSQDRADYFGFFYHEDDAMDHIMLLNRIWKTPLCGRSSYERVERCCLNFQLKKCCGPCCGRITPEQYRRNIAEASRCLQGNSTRVVNRLRRQMKEAAEQLQFERAMELRDAMQGLEELRRKNKRLSTMLDKRDIFLFFRAYREQGIFVFYISKQHLKAGIRLDGKPEEIPILMEFFQAVRSNNAQEKYRGFDQVLHLYQGKVGEEQSQSLSELEIYMSICLRDTYADKWYVPISRRVSPEKAGKLLADEWLELIEDKNKVRPSRRNWRDSIQQGGRSDGSQ